MHGELSDVQLFTLMHGGNGAKLIRNESRFVLNLAD